MNPVAFFIHITTEATMNVSIMRAAGFGAEVDAVLKGRCPFCNVSVKREDLRDDLSRLEHNISGLCQMCQDDMFGKESP
jgi:hypothetical protein